VRKALQATLRFPGEPKTPPLQASLSAAMQLLGGDGKARSCRTKGVLCKQVREQVAHAQDLGVAEGT